MAGINSTIAPYVTIDSFLDYAKEELGYVNAYLEARAVDAKITDADGNDTGRTERILNVTAFGNNALDNEGHLELSDVTGLPVVYSSQTIWSNRVLSDAMFELLKNGMRIADAELRWGCWREDDDAEPVWAKAPRVHSITLSDGSIIVMNGERRESKFDDTDSDDDDATAQLGDE